MRIAFIIPVFLAISTFASSAAAIRPLRFELSTDPLVWDLTGASFSRGYQGRFDAMREVQLDSLSVGMPVSKRLRLMGRVEVGVDDDRRSREVVVGAFEMGVRYQPLADSSFVRPFVSAGAGWVGGGIISPDTIDLWDHELDPQLHVLAGLDLRLSGGWSFEVRLPFRYLWGPDRPLAAATVGFRHSM